MIRKQKKKHFKNMCFHNFLQLSYAREIFLQLHIFEQLLLKAIIPSSLNTFIEHTAFHRIEQVISRYT